MDRAHRNPQFFVRTTEPNTKLIVSLSQADHLVHNRDEALPAIGLMVRAQAVRKRWPSCMHTSHVLVLANSHLLHVQAALS